MTATAWEKLAWMTKFCLHVRVSTNEHRAYYETVEQHLSTRDEDLFDPEDADVQAECILRNELQIVQVYPITPIGFYRVGHHDLAAAIDLAYECARKEVESAITPVEVVDKSEMLKRYPKPDGAS